MKDYTHKGVVSNKGTVNTDEIITDSSVLEVLPGDNSYHLTGPVVGNFEWWYFDIINIKTNCIIKIVVHIGTDPLKTTIFPQLALSISTEDKSEYITKHYKFQDFEGSPDFCHIKLKDDIEIMVKYNRYVEYHIKVYIQEFTAIFRFISDIEGWKPLGNEVSLKKGTKSGKFSWIIPVPKAKVSGIFKYSGKEHKIQNAIGYHDHNYWIVDKKQSLFLDNIVSKWYWGKCYCRDYTIIFMDTHFRTNALRSIMIARDNKIIHSSNNLIDVYAGKRETDNMIKAEFPGQITILLNDDSAPCKVLLRTKRIIDKKDLLEGVLSPLKWFINHFISRPVYFGIFADAVLEIDKKKFEGFGNYEIMVFREHER